MNRGNNPGVCIKGGVTCKNHELKKDYDPRSYCHSIVSHPDNVCKKTICQKSMKKIEQDSSEYVVCIPHSTCKTERLHQSSTETNGVKNKEESKNATSKDGVNQERETYSKEISYEFQGYMNPIIQTLSKETVLSGKFGAKIDEELTKHSQSALTQNIGSKKPNMEKNLEVKPSESASQHAVKPVENSEPSPGRTISSRKLNIEKIFEKRQTERNALRSSPMLSNMPHRSHYRKVSVKKYDENTMKLLKELTKTLGSEGISAISHLVKAEICSCCRCMICRCKKKKSSTMFLEDQDRDFQKEVLAMEMAYSWAFDYFDTPDLETFEIERQQRLETERRQAEEEEVSLLIEEMLKEDGVNANEPLSDIQTKEILEKIKEIVSQGNLDIDAGAISKKKYSENEGRQEGITISKTPSYLETTEEIEINKLNEQKNLEHVKNASREYSISNKHLSEPAERGRKAEFPEYNKNIPLTKSSRGIPAVQNRQDSSIRPPARQSISSNSRKPKRKKKLQKNLSEPKNQKVKRMSYKESLTLSKESTQWYALPSDGTGQKTFQKENEDILPYDSEVGEDFHVGSVHFLGADDIQIASEDRYSIDSMMYEGDEQITKPPSVVELSSKLILALTRASAAAKKRVEARKFTLHPSLRHYTDICNCLPGACTCGSHYIFRHLKHSTPIDADFIIASNESSCLCLHSLEDIEEEEEEKIETYLDYDRFRWPDIRRTEFIRCDRQPKYEKTVIIIKPEATKFKDVVLRAITKEGLDIIDERFLHLTPEQVTEIYEENYESPYFFMFVKQMSSTPIWVLSVAGSAAIERMKNLIGKEDAIHSSWFYPESMKRRFGLHTDIYGALKTSSENKSASRDLKYIFPLDILEPISIDSIEVQDYCDKYVNPVIMKALYMILREKPRDPIMYLANWLLRNNPNTPFFSDALTALAPT